MSGTIVATIIARAQRRIVSDFRNAGATAKDGPIAYAAPDKRNQRRVFERMVAFGAIEKTPAGTYWLNEARLRDFRKESLAHVLGILAIAGLAAAGALAIRG